MPANDKWTPKTTGIRDPRDAKKKSGMFSNWPRFLYLGGPANGIGLNQDGNRGPSLGPAKGNSIGPVSDRGKGRR